MFTFFYFKSIDVVIFQMNSVNMCQKCLVLGANNFECTQRFSNTCKKDIMMSTKDFFYKFQGTFKAI